MQKIEEKQLNFGSVISFMGGGGSALTAFTRPGRGEIEKNSKSAAKFGFTMAEILLSLTIIGVVAAITLPSLTGNINERTWNSQRKALYSRMSQAVSMLPSLRGYGTTSNVSMSTQYESWSALTTTDASEAFVTEGLSKVLKINNICDVDHLADCGLPDKIISVGGSNTISLATLKKMSGLASAFSTTYCNNNAVDSDAVGFETANGESVILHYNPRCIYFDSVELLGAAINTICLNMVYDLNGQKGPNTVGKDIGIITTFYPTDPVVVAPIPAAQGQRGDFAAASTVCKSLGEDYRIPTVEEAISLASNYGLFDMNMNGGYLVTSYKTNRGFTDGVTRPISVFVDNAYLSLGADRILCVKR